MAKFEEFGPVDCSAIPLSDPQSITIDGHVVTFAIAGEGVAIDKLLFRVLAPQTTKESRDELSWSPWYIYVFPGSATEFASSFPRNSELRIAGLSAFSAPPSTAQQIAPGRDYRVSRDGERIVVFRSTADGNSVYINRFALLSREMETEEDPQKGAAPGTSDSSAGQYHYALAPISEVRFVGSGLRDIPADVGDRLSVKSASGALFVEPTIQVIGVVSSGGFDVASVALPEADQVLWYVGGRDSEMPEQFYLSLITQVEAGFAEAKIVPCVVTFDSPGFASGTALAGSGIALATYAEQSVCKTAQQAAADLPVAQRLMIALPFTYPSSTSSAGNAAVAVFDFGLSSAGIPANFTESPVSLTLSGFSDAATAMRYQGTTLFAEGLTIRSFAFQSLKAGSNLTLYAGDDGLVHLYYTAPWTPPEPDMPSKTIAYAAQYDPRVSRQYVMLPTLDATDGGTGTMYLVARSCDYQIGTTVGPSSSPANISISAYQPSGFSTTLGELEGAFLNINLEIVGVFDASLTESWSGLPRDAISLAAVLNGMASADPFDPDVQSGATLFYDYLGQYSQCRVPTVAISDTTPPPADPFTDAGDCTNYRSHLTVVSKRFDLELTAIKTAFSDNEVVMEIAFQLSTSEGFNFPQSIMLSAQTLTGLPTLADLLDVLTGPAPILLANSDLPTAVGVVRQGGQVLEGPILIFASWVDPNSSMVPCAVTLAVGAGTTPGTITYSGTISSPSTVGPYEAVIPSTACPSDPASFLSSLLQISLQDGQTPFPTLPYLGTAWQPWAADGGAISPTEQTAEGLSVMLSDPGAGYVPMSAKDALSLFAFIPPSRIPPPSRQVYAPSISGTIGKTTFGPMRQGRICPPGAGILPYTEMACLYAAFDAENLGGPTAVVTTDPSQLTFGAERDGKSFGPGWLVETLLPQVNFASGPTGAGLSFTGSAGDFDQVSLSDRFSCDMWLQPSGAGSVITSARTTEPAAPGGQVSRSYALGLEAPYVIALSVDSYSAANVSMTLQHLDTPITIDFFIEGSLDTLGTSAPLFQITDVASMDYLSISVVDRRLIFTMGGGSSSIPLERFSEFKWWHIAITVSIINFGSSQQFYSARFYINGDLVPSNPPQRMTRWLITTFTQATYKFGKTVSSAGTACQLLVLRFWGTGLNDDQIKQLAAGARPAGMACLLEMGAGVDPSQTGAAEPQFLITSPLDILTNGPAILQPAQGTAPQLEPTSGLFDIRVAAGGVEALFNRVASPSTAAHLSIGFRSGGGIALNGGVSGLCDTAGELTFSSFLGIELDLFASSLPPGTTSSMSLCGIWPKPTAGPTLDGGQRFRVSISDAGDILLSVAVKTTDRGATSQEVQVTFDAADVFDPQSACRAGRIFLGFEIVSEGVENPPTTGVESPKPATDLLYRFVPYLNGVEMTDRASVQPATLSTLGVVLFATSDAPLFVGLGPDDDAGVSADVSIGRLALMDKLPPAAYFSSLLGLRPRPPIDLLPLVAQWDFAEQQGRQSLDVVDAHLLKFDRADMWSPQITSSELRFFVDGDQLFPSQTAFFDAVPTTDSFAIGAASSGFSGSLSQLSIWNDVPDAAAVRNRMFTQLYGDEANLSAAWNFVSEGGVPPYSNIVTGQADLIGTPGAAAVTTSVTEAPLGLEGPYLQNAWQADLDGKQTAAGARPTLPFVPAAPGRVAVAASVETRWSETAAPQAFLNRQYILDPNEPPLPPITVGQLGLTYLGQIQTQPNLIGFIEGAPPVPSENLTRPYWASTTGAPYMKYLDTSKVSLVKSTSLTESTSDTTEGTFHYSSSVSVGIVTDVEAEIGGDVPFVVQYELGAYKQKESYMVGGGLDYEIAKQTTTSKDLVRSLTEADTIGFSGDWEPYQPDSANYPNPDIGRRFVPDNLGYALVESMTADLYAVTHKERNVALSTVAIPNPDIPMDRNIILFPIDPTYVKAGTLDGRIGLIDDIDFQGAPRDSRSYFRPAEAYDLASEIERQQLQVNADVPDKKTNIKSETKRMLKKKRAGIVNRYVWSADGGLHQEANSYTASFGTTHSLSNAISVQGSGQGEGSYTASFGLGWSLNLTLSGGAIFIDASSETRSGGASLDVSLEGEAFLSNWKPLAPGTTPPPGVYADALGYFERGAGVGKVRSYRFMSYFLPPSSKNSEVFKSIVDPLWLQYSGSPLARALQTANVSNPAWRVLHRVTYVERVPPVVGAGTVTSTAPELPMLVNLETNASLIAFILNYIGGESPDPTKMTVSRIEAAVGELMPLIAQGMGVAVADPPGIQANLVRYLTTALAEGGAEFLARVSSSPAMTGTRDRLGGPFALQNANRR